MPNPVVAIAGSSAVGAVASSSAAKRQASATMSAAEMQYDATMAGIDLQREMFEQQRKDYEPYRKIGSDVIGEMFSQRESLMKPFSFEDFTTSPEYQFTMDEGRKAIETGAAARGDLMSGATLKALTRFGQNTANQFYNNAFDRYNINQTNRFNRMAALAGIGQAATNQLAGLGSGMANNVSNLTVAGGNALAAGVQGAGAARAAGTMGASNAFNSGLQNYLGYNAFQQYMNPPTPQQPYPNDTGFGGGISVGGN